MNTNLTFLIKAQVVALFFTLNATAQQFQVAVSTSTDPVNLTTVGITDWKHFGSITTSELAIDSMDRGGINSSISNFVTTSGASASFYDDDPRKFSWSNGTPLANNVDDANGVYFEGLENGFTFTIKVKSGNNKIYLYLGGYQSSGKLTLTSTNPSVTVYTVTNDPPTLDASTPLVYTVDYNSSTAETVTVNWVSAAEFDGYCNVTMKGVAYANSPTTPLDVTSYTVTKSANNVILNWTTANEVNVKGFNIERSNDGKMFTTIATPATKGAGTYSYIDNSPAVGINYYKLSSVDVDGTTVSKGLKTVKFSLNGADGFSMYPNPTSDVLNIIPTSVFANLNIVDLAGKVVLSKVIVGSSIVSLATLPKGVYLVQLTENGLTTVKKLVKH